MIVAVNWRQKIVLWSERAGAALLAVLLLGGVLGFGGAVWWFRPFLVIVAVLLASTQVFRSLGAGRMPVLKSPLGFLGMLVLGLGVLQLAPLPARLAGKISPAAHEAYTRGALTRLVHEDDPQAALPKAPRYARRQPSTGRQPYAG